jgi:uncharacterized membrane protein YfcA
MRNIGLFLLVLLALSIILHPVQAAGTPPPAATSIPNGQTNNPAAGFPWGLIIVFIGAGFIMTYIKKNSPNTITTTTCIPLIDEKKMEAEKKKIAEEEASQRKS